MVRGYNRARVAVRAAIKRYEHELMVALKRDLGKRVGTRLACSP